MTIGSFEFWKSVDATHIHKGTKLLLPVPVWCAAILAAGVQRLLEPCEFLIVHLNDVYFQHQQPPSGVQFAVPCLDGFRREG